jgi:2-hydroxychromene-2-carboxylate isomerase
MPKVDFWFEFASTYSYPAAMRIGALAKAHGVEIRWRPFLLGPIFASRGMLDSPFNLNAAKGRYMWSDLSRICARLGLALHRPDPFPQNSLLASRVALALDPDRRGEFARAVYAAEFADGASIGERTTIAEILKAMGLPVDDMLARATSEAIKDALKRETAQAERLGIFGAPNLVTEDDELFWGNDRLEEGLDWAVAKAPGGA